MSNWIRQAILCLCITRNAKQIKQGIHYSTKYLKVVTAMWLSVCNWAERSLLVSQRRNLERQTNDCREFDQYMKETGYSFHENRWTKGFIMHMIYQRPNPNLSFIWMTTNTPSASVIRSWQVRVSLGISVSPLKLGATLN